MWPARSKDATRRSTDVMHYTMASCTWLCRGAWLVQTCTSEAREGTQNAYSVTCTHGTGTYVQSVTRAFRLTVPDTDLDNGDGATTQREFAYATPTRFSGHQCPYYDAWGVNGYNDQYYSALGGACIPSTGWTQSVYQLSNPDEWLYNINNRNGWGSHPDYWINPSRFQKNLTKPGYDLTILAVQR